MRAGFKVVSFYWNKGEKICVPLIELDSIIIYEFFLGGKDHRRSDYIPFLLLLSRNDITHLMKLNDILYHINNHFNSKLDNRGHEIVVQEWFQYVLDE